MTRPKRIVCYAINGSGLGHLTRLIAVARWLRRFVALLDQRSPEVMFLTSSDASDALASAGFAAFKIPSKTAARKAELNKLEYRRLAKHFVWHTLGVFSPDLFVVDTFPSGSFDELFQVLDGPFKKGFIFRNVQADYAARATFRTAIGLYDTVVVPHRRQHIEPSQVVTDDDVRFCGEVIQFEREELLPAAVAREQLGVASGHRLVYVSAGGGGDPNAEQTLSSLVKSLQGITDVHLLVGAGPLYRGSRLSGPRLTWFDAPLVWRYFSAVDAAICAAGYNTFHELLYAQVPAAFFAQARIADDQARRITQAEQAGACRQISDITDAKLVFDTTRDLLDPSNAAAMRDASGELLAENGARQCALELLRPLYEASRLDWAATLLTPRITHSLERIGEGSSTVLAEWLTPLMPLGHVQTMSCHPGFDGVLDRLSPAAAKEVKQILAEGDEALDQAAFESTLIHLLDTIDAYGSTVPVTGVTGTNVPRTSDQQAHISLRFADEVRKTMLAAMKKQPLETTCNGNRTRWVCAAIEGVHDLSQLAGDGLTECDVLGLFRMFPRVVDIDIREAFDLFTRFLRQRQALGERAHEIMHQLQVLKMSHQRVTRAMIDTLLEGVVK